MSSPPDGNARILAAAEAIADGRPIDWAALDVKAADPAAQHVLDELRVLEQSGRRYGMVILDPPAFARSRQAVRHALAGYKDLNLRAFRLLAPEGFLVSCSCSQHVPQAEFWDVILTAARDARRTVRLIEQRSQGPDHPVLGAMPETRYLKCFLVQVM